MLTRSIRDRSGKTIRTTADAEKYVLKMLKAKPRYNSWKYAAKLLLANASAEAITNQIEFALLHDDAALDVAFTADQVRRSSP